MSLALVAVQGMTIAPQGIVSIGAGTLTINTFSHVFPELGRAAAKPAAEHLNDDVSLAPIGQKCTILMLMLSK